MLRDNEFLYLRIFHERIRFQLVRKTEDVTCTCSVLVWAQEFIWKGSAATLIEDTITFLQAENDAGLRHHVKAVSGAKKYAGR